MLQDPLNAVLGTKTKVKLLRNLIFLDRSVTGREAARLAGVSHIAQQALTELASRLLPEHGITLSPVVLTMAELSLQMDDQCSFAAQALDWTRNVYGPPVEELLNSEAA